MRNRSLVCALLLALCACGGGAGPAGDGGAGGGAGSGSSSDGGSGGGGSSGGGSGGSGGGAACIGVTCSGHGTCTTSGSSPVCTCDPGYGSAGTTECVASDSPALGGCPMLPADNLFNTEIVGLDPHPDSAAFMATIGEHNLHLDLGTQTDPGEDDYWGIPYNVVHGNGLSWTSVRYDGAPDESDCTVASAGGAHTIVSPCTAERAPDPVFPIPASPLVESGLAPGGDHHMLIVDADTCRLWELYGTSPYSGSGWEIYGSAGFDLRSNTLRPDEWTSADAAGFPMLPLLLRVDEASSGVIRHALRFTNPSSTIRGEHVWPARHHTYDNMSSALPAMGQLFRLKSTYTIPDSFNTQARAILQALKTYGMYLADNSGGSSMYIQGEPSAAWEEDTFSQVQSVSSSEFEAVDLSEFTSRPGFDPDSGRVPPR